MKRDSVKIAASALTLTTVVNALIQSSIANSEPNASSGRCQRTEGKKKWKWGDRETVNKGIRKSGYQEIRD